MSSYIGSIHMLQNLKCFQLVNSTLQLLYLAVITTVAIALEGSRIAMVTSMYEQSFISLNDECHIEHIAISVMHDTGAL